MNTPQDEWVQTRWHKNAEHLDCPPEYIKWLTSTESLTTRLNRITNNGVELRVLEAQWGLAHFTENDLLNNISEPVWIRQTIQLYQKKPWIWAKVTIPALTLEKTGLDGQVPVSIGNILFQDPNLQRTELAIAFLPVNHFYHQSAAPYSARPDEGYWARRSILWFRQHPILVIEVFLPGFFDYVQSL